MLSEFKFFVRDQLGLPSWLVLIAAGFIAHVVLNTLLRKPVTSYWGLIGPVGLGVALECYEIWRHYRSVGLFAPGNDPLLTILSRHSVDILWMLTGPIAIVVVGTTLFKSN